MLAIGLDVGGTNLRLALVNEQGELLFHLKEATPQNSAESLITTVVSMYHRACAQYPHKKIEGLGIGWPGTVDRLRGTVIETPNLKAFQNFDLLARLSADIKVNLKLENDAKCAGLAERYFGVARAFNDFVLLTFGTGIGGVIFTDGMLVRGRSGLAGEIGHMCLYPEGIACGCGSFGCFEKYCSAKALEDRSKALGHNISARDLLTNPLPWSTQLLEDFCRDLALAIGSLTNILDPEAFVFSGGLFTTGGGPILAKLQTHLSHQGFKKGKQNLKLLSSELEGKAGVIGAASLILLADRRGQD